MREAAWLALGRLGTPGSLEALKDAWFKARNDTALETLGTALGLAPELPFMGEILTWLRQEMADLAALPEDSKEEELTGRFQRFITRLLPLRGKDTDEVLDFLALLL